MTTGPWHECPTLFSSARNTILKWLPSRTWRDTDSKLILKDRSQQSMVFFRCVQDRTHLQRNEHELRIEGIERRIVMAVTTASKTERTTRNQSAIARLYVLDLSGNRIFSANPDGSDKTVIVTDCRVPDGIAVDVEGGHIYWTNMGNPKVNDGSIERVDLNGGNRTAIIPPGGTFTPKQLHLDRENRKLYWSDGEGMRVMRANLDGSQIETLVDSSQGDARPGRDATKWCVGITVDPERGHIYWTQKGPDNAELGKLFR